MYKATCDGEVIYDPTKMDQKRLYLGDPKVQLEENSAGTFEFTIYPNHPRFGLIHEQTSEVILTVDDDGTLFRGRVMDIKTDIYNVQTVYCEGELGYLNDSIQRPHEYNGETVEQFLQALISNHNQQVSGSTGIDKTFYVGTVTVVDSTGVYKFTNYNTTLETIKTDLLETYGGHIVLTHDTNGIRIDYLADYPNTNSQTVKVTKNVVSCDTETDHSDIFTVLIPLGASKEGTALTDNRLTIASVNGGLDYISDTVGVQRYGTIIKTVVFDDVTVASNLLSKGQAYFTENCGYDMTTGEFIHKSLEVKFVDMHLINPLIERVKLLDLVHVVSDIQGIDTTLPVTEMTVYLDKPADNVITLGTIKETMTSQTLSTDSTVEQQEEKEEKVITNTLFSSATIPTGTNKSLGSVTLSSGTYILLGVARFPTNTTGHRNLHFSAGADGSQINRFGSTSSAGSAGGNIILQVVYTLTVTGTTTIYLTAYQTSGANMQIDNSGVRVIKIG